MSSLENDDDNDEDAEHGHDGEPNTEDATRWSDLAAAVQLNSKLNKDEIYSF